MLVGQPCPLHPQSPLEGACDRCGDFGCRQCIPNGRTCVRCVPNWEVTKPDFGKSFSEVMNDPQVRGSVGAGALCILGSFLLVPMFILMGYHARIARQERDRPHSGLPSWDGIGALAWDGFKSYLCICLPTLTMYLMFGIAMGIAMATSMPAGPGPAGNPPPVLMVVMFGGLIAFYGFLFVYMAIMPAVQIQYLRSGSVLAAFHLRALWRIIVGRPVDYFIFLVISVALYMLATIVGELLCLVGLFATMPFGLYVQGHYLGRFCAWLDASDATS